MICEEKYSVTTVILKNVLKSNVLPFFLNFSNFKKIKHFWITLRSVRRRCSEMFQPQTWHLPVADSVSTASGKQIIISFH